MWRFVHCSPGGTPLAELLNISDRKVSLQVSKLDSLTFGIRLDNPATDDLLTCQGMIQGYWNGDLRYTGHIVSTEETGDAQGSKVAITSAGLGWELTKRLEGKSATGFQVTTPTDRTTIAWLILTRASAAWPITVDLSFDKISPTGSLITYVGGPYKFALECINELADAVDGFDWRFIPHTVVNTGGNTATWGSLKATPAFGTVRENTIFEYGDGRHNLVNYRIINDRTNQANSLFHSTSNGPEAPGFPTMNYVDTPSVQQWNLLEDQVSSDATDPGVRQDLLISQARLRSQPRTIITYESNIDDRQGRLPVYGEDYEVGDFIRGRGVVRGSTRFDAFFRTWGVEFTQGSNAQEKVSLLLEEQGA